MLRVFQKRVRFVPLSASRAAVMPVCPFRRGILLIHRLGDSCPAFQPDGGDEGPSGGQLLRKHGRAPAEEDQKHAHYAVRACIFALRVQHGNNKRRRTYRICPIRPHHTANGGPGVPRRSSGGAADCCGESRQHADAHGKSPKPVPVQPLRDGLR